MGFSSLQLSICRFLCLYSTNGTLQKMYQWCHYTWIVLAMFLLLITKVFCKSQGELGCIFEWVVACLCETVAVLVWLPICNHQCRWSILYRDQPNSSVALRHWGGEGWESQGFFVISFFWLESSFNMTCCLFRLYVLLPSDSTISSETYRAWQYPRWKGQRSYAILHKTSQRLFHVSFSF